MATSRGGERPERYTESWWWALRRSTGYRSATKVVGSVMAEHADYDTGRNCWPSAPTIAAHAGVSVATVKREQAALEADGWIRRTGKTRPNNATDWELINPPGRINVAPTGRINVAPTDPSRSYQNQAPVVSESGAGRINVDPQPRYPETEGGGVAGDTAGAPVADAPVGPACLSRKQITATVTRILPPSWDAYPITMDDPDLGDALTSLIAGGWPIDALRLTCRGLPQMRDPNAATDVLVKRLRRSVGKSPGVTPAAARKAQAEADAQARTAAEAQARIAAQAQERAAKEARELEAEMRAEREAQLDEHFALDGIFSGYLPAWQAICDQAVSV